MRRAIYIATVALVSLLAWAVMVQAAQPKKTKGYSQAERLKKAKRSSSAAQPKKLNRYSLKSAIVMDVGSGQILYEQNADTPIAPASLTKILSLYLVREDIAAGRIRPSDRVRVDGSAESAGGSSMLLKSGDIVTVAQLMEGMAVASGNDASVAIASYLGGNVDSFVKRMNRKAKLLGMTSSCFKNPHGLPAKGQVTTARDMLRLGASYLAAYPDSLDLHSRQTMHYKKQVRKNSNKLLGMCPGVDGLKTGYVASSGFNLIVTVKRNNRRLVAVVMGGESAKIRNREAMRLIDACYSIPEAGKPILGGTDREHWGDSGGADVVYGLQDVVKERNKAPVRQIAVEIVAGHASGLEAATGAARTIEQHEQTDLLARMFTLGVVGVDNSFGGAAPEELGEAGIGASTPVAGENPVSSATEAAFPAASAAEERLRRLAAGEFVAGPWSQDLAEHPAGLPLASANNELAESGDSGQSVLPSLDRRTAGDVLRQRIAKTHHSASASPPSTAQEVERIASVIQAERKTLGPNTSSSAPLVRPASFDASLNRQAVAPTSYQVEEFSRTGAESDSSLSFEAGEAAIETGRASDIVAQGAERNCYLLHESSWKTRDKASARASELQRKGLSSSTARIDLGSKGIWYRVYVGTFASEREAEMFKNASTRGPDLRHALVVRQTT